jgi:hypothetical protein
MVKKVGLLADRLVKEAQGSYNHNMILYVLGRELTRLGAELSPYLLRDIVMKAARRKAGYAEYLQHLGDVKGLASHTGNDFMSQVLQVCRRRQVDEVVELLTEAPPQRRIYHTEEIESTSQEQDYMPLGVKKSLARKQNMGTLEALLRDQDPAVIRNLLANPRTVEEMVIKMASLRPTSEDVLQEIYVSQKWISRYSVRKALVFNPYSPPRAAHSLLPTLLMADLIDVTQSSVLLPALRSAAKRFIMHRMSEMSPSEREQFSERYSKILKRIFLQVG